MQVARRVQDERRIKDGKSKSGEDLDEEQGRGSLGDVSEPAFPVRHERILNQKDKIRVLTVRGSLLSFIPSYLGFPADHKTKQRSTLFNDAKNAVSFVDGH